ncbi:MAG: hypothetical protein VYB73_02625 [Verrucomicrobiota bacterium]|nr:hypothetical protein [Verrucomicrobiota bacterium]
MKLTTPSKAFISRIRKALSGNDPDASVNELATEFSAFCNDALSRFEECCEINVAEDAVKIAESEVPLMESLETLERFPLFSEWVSYCKKNSLEEPELIPAGSTEKLIGIYKKWSGVNEFLRKKYRDAAIRKDDSLLLSYAGRILKVDPSDEAAKDETKRILRRYFRNEIKELDELVISDDRLSAMAIVDRLDQLPFDDLKKGKSWDAAIKWLNAERRASDEKIAARLISGLPTQCSERALDSVKSTVDEIESIIKTHRIDLDKDADDILSESKEWIIEEEERIIKEEKSKDVNERFSKEITNIESNWHVILKSPLKEIEGSRRKLTNCWSEVQKLELELADGVEQKVREYTSQLDERIGKLKKKLRRRLITRVGTFLAVSSFIALYVFAQLRSETLKEQFEGYKSARTVRPFERLVKSTETYRWPIAFLARMGPEIKNAKAWIDFELDQYQLLYDKINDLNTEADSGFGRPINEYWEEFIKLRKGIADSATDLRIELNKHIESLERKWGDHRISYVGEQRARRNKVLKDIASILNLSPKLSVVARNEEYVKRVHSINDELDDSMKVMIPPAFLSDKTKEELRSIGPELKEFIGQIDSFRNVIKAMNEAKTYAEFTMAMKTFTGESFSGTPEQVAADLLVENDKKHVDVVGEILRPSQSKGWSFFLQNRKKEKIFPKDIEEAERVVLNQISKDEKYVNLHKCFFTEIPSGRTFHKFCDGPTKLRNRKVGSNSIVERSGYFFDNAKFISGKFEYFDSGIFELKDEQLKKAKGITLSKEEVTQESVLFNAVRPTQRMMSQSQQYYKDGILIIFDEINSAEKVSPLYRAYLQTEYAKAILRRPHGWGLILAPSFLRDLELIQEKKPPILGRNDWMIESRHTKEDQDLKEFYDSKKGESYVLEAKINQGLIEGVIETGFDYAGFVNHDGALILQDSAKSAKVLYGSPSSEKHAVPLFRKNEGGNEDLLDGGKTKGWKLEGNVAPFTPLLYFKGDRLAVIEAVSSEQGLTEEKIRSLAIPFFNETE